MPPTRASPQLLFHTFRPDASPDGFVRSVGQRLARIFRDKRYRPARLKFIHPAQVSSRSLPRTTNFSTDRTRANCSRTKRSSTCAGSRPSATRDKSPIARPIATTSHSPSLLQLYGKRFFDQGGNMSGVFKYPSTLKPEAYQRLKKTSSLNRSVCTTPTSRCCWRAV